MINSLNNVIFMSILGIDITALYAILTAINSLVAEKLSVPLLLVVFLISWGLSTALRRLKWPKPALTALSWLPWPVALLFIIKIQLFANTGFTDTDWLLAIPHAFSVIFQSFEPALLVLITSMLLWWLGRRTAYIEPAFRSVMAEFQFGLVAVLLVLFLSYELNLNRSSSLATAMIFFSLGLIGIAVSQYQNTSRKTLWSQGPWFGVLIVSILLILLLGLAVSLIMTPDLLNLVLDGLRWLWGLVEKALNFLANLLPHSDPGTPPPAMPTIPGVEPGEPGGFSFTWPPWLLSILRWTWIVLVGGLVIVAVWRVTSDIIEWARRRTAGPAGEREPLKGAFKADLLNWLKRMLYLLFRVRFRTGAKGKSSDITPEAGTVRQLYRQVLRWADGNGHPRQATQTSEEYRKALENVIPGSEDLSYITKVYSDARYGGARPSLTDLNQMKQKWHNLKRAGFKRPNSETTRAGDTINGNAERKE